jgi:hypothetical protein
MIQLIVGEKGKGKTKHLLDRVNNSVQTANGNIIYIDKSTKHMYELNNKVRLINSEDYELLNTVEFLGFINGILAQDNDIEEIFIESFLTTAKVDMDHLEDILNRVKRLSEMHHTNFVISLSMNAKDLPGSFEEDIWISL